MKNKTPLHSLQTKTSLTSDLAIRFHHALLIFQRRMRRVRLDYEFPIGRDSAMILAMISNKSSLTSTGISQQLGIPKAKVSRLMIALEKNGYLRLEGSETDRRVKELVFTLEGQRLKEQLIRLNNEISARGMHSATEEQREISERLLKCFNTGMNFLDTPADPLETPLVVQQRILTNGSGMIGSDYLNTGFSLLEIHILFELSLKKNLNFADIVTALPFDTSSISRAIAGFESKGYLLKVTSNVDKRAIICRLTESGKQLKEDIDKKLSQKILTGLVDASSEDIRGFIDLMDSLNVEPIPPAYAKEIQLRICKTSEDFKLARSVYVEILVMKKKHTNLSSSLIPEESLCVVFLENDNPIGVLSFDNSGLLEAFEMNTSRTFSDSEIDSLFKKAKKLITKESGLVLLNSENS